MILTSLTDGRGSVWKWGPRQGALLSLGSAHHLETTRRAARLHSADNKKLDRVTSTHYNNNEC